MGRAGFGWLRIGCGGRFFEHGNEPSCSIKEAGYCLTNLVTINFSKNMLRCGVSKHVSKLMQII